MRWFSAVATLIEKPFFILLPKLCWMKPTPGRFTKQEWKRELENSPILSMVGVVRVRWNYPVWHQYSWIQTPRGSSYFTLSEVAIINPKNTEKCFRWCLLRGLNPKSVYLEGITDLKQNTELTFGEIEFPVKLMHFTKFEKLNPRVPGINVFGYEDREKRIFPLWINEKDTKNVLIFCWFPKGWNKPNV